MLQRLKNYVKERRDHASLSMKTGFHYGQKFGNKGAMSLSPGKLMAFVVGITFVTAVTPNILGNFTNIKNDGNLSASEAAIAGLLALAFVGGLVFTVVKATGLPTGGK